MSGSTFGTQFKISTFGESHGSAIGVVIDGCPAGLGIDETFIQAEMDRRKPGQSKMSSARKESDTIEILSGVFEGKSLGTPIAILIRNEDAKSKDYDYLKNTYRPSHADYTWEQKYGFRDYRGGGRSSARETAARVAAGAIAKLYLNHFNISIHAFVKQVGKIRLQKEYTELDLSKIQENEISCPDESVAKEMIQYIEEIKKQGDTVGGIIQCVIQNCPSGLGEPVFDKLHADLGKAMLSINAVHGFEYGSGFASATKLGSENNDALFSEDEKIKTRTNHAGGILGGISNGEDMYFNVAFKPVATIMQRQESVDKEGNSISLENRGRHDACVLPRAVPIVEAMTALVLADHHLRNRTAKI